MSVVKHPSSWHLGVWRGAYGKPRDVPLADGIDALTYRAGHEDGIARSREIRAAGRVKRRPACAIPAEGFASEVSPPFRAAA